MNLIKKTTTGLLICLILFGCAFFAAAGKKLSEYCPGLNIKLDGVSISINDGKEVTVVQYDDSWQKKVNAYFTDKANGYTGVGDKRRYMSIKANDEPIVADGDSILTKTIVKGNKTATVIYNVSARKIAIVEEKDE
jgi:hypothetical protein